jgi:parallel beta-helix repeat protein
MRTAAAVALVLGLVGEPGALPGATYFVNHQHPEAADTNAGTAGAPFRTIQAAADKVQPGDTILVRGGTYRETIVWQTPGRSDARITLSAATGETVVVKGSLVVTGWDRVAAKEAGLGDWPWANLWAKRDWKLKHILPPHAPASRAPNWLCWTDHPRQAFWKDAALEGAGRLAPAFFRWELEEGRIFHDRQAEVLYVWLPAGVDPNKDGIEVCVRPLLLTQVPRADRRCPFDCVTIRGLQFRHATPRSLTNWSAGGISGTGGVFEDCLVSWNDYVGWSVGGTSNTVRRCIFAYNGMAGLGGCGEGHLIEDNLVVANNIDNYVYFNSSGGGKLTNLRHTTFRRHKARFNNGCGLWLDIECNDNIFESCEFSHNGGAGLDIEISRRNLVRNCIFAFNTMRPSGYAIGHAGKEENQRVYDAGGGGWGLSNRGSEGTRVLNCLFYGNAEGGLMLGGGGRTWTENDPGTGSNVVHETVGRDLVAVNNILAHNGRWQLAFVNPNKQKEATGCRSDHNLFWGPNPVDGYGGLADWTRQTGFDAHSIEAMPDVPLAFAGFFAPAATAPEVDAGTLAPECPVDWHGLARPVGRARRTGRSCRTDCASRRWT